MMLKIFAKELKGDIEHLEVDTEQKINVLSIIPVYNLLSHQSSWLDIKKMKTLWTVHV